MEHLLIYLANGNFILPYLLVFGSLLVCGFGVPIPEDITLIAAGIASYYGYGNVYVMIAVAFTGILMGDSIIFYMGSRFGERIKKFSWFQRVVPEPVLLYIEQRLATHGNKLVFVARFMPGLRAPIYFTAGMMKIRFAVFFTFDFMAALISVPAIIYAVYHFGDNIDVIVRAIKRIQHGMALVAVMVVGLIALHSYLSSRKLKKTEMEALANRE